ncbi:MAG: WG repeat-containing protein, partial [Acidovorax sp.]|nr:WG repeat-containing protein [Acidovorax sp.]
TTRLIDNDLARAHQKGEPRHGSHWHVQRAWAHLWSHQPALALEDALQGLPHARYPQHAHYVLASAYRALGQTRQAALEASTVLSLQSPYAAEWDAHEDTTWLAPLAREHMQAADEATLVQQLQSHPRTLADVPRARITHAMVDAALQADESAVCFVPKRLMTPARYAAALRQGVKTLEQIPAPMLSEEACADHVREAGWRLADVPTPWRTVAVCAVAMQANASALPHVPARLQPQVLQAAQALAVQTVSDSQEQGAIAQRLAEQLAVQWQALQRTPGMPWMQRARRQGGWVALLAGSLMTPSSQAPTQGGLVGWMQQRPVLALLLHLLGGACALVGHAFVSVGAWRAEGAYAGLASFTLLGFSELYWAWRFVWTEPARPLLGTTAALVAAYVLCWWPLYRKAGQALAQPRPDRT